MHHDGIALSKVRLLNSFVSKRRTKEKRHTQKFFWQAEHKTRNVPTFKLKRCNGTFQIEGLVLKATDPHYHGLTEGERGDNAKKRNVWLVAGCQGNCPKNKRQRKALRAQWLPSYDKLNVVKV
jgi:hypothetical protein